MPPKFLISHVTPSADQGNRGDCWMFSTGGLIESSYLDYGLKKGWLNGSTYMKLNRQALSVAIMEECKKKPYEAVKEYLKYIEIVMNYSLFLLHGGLYLQLEKILNYLSNSIRTCLEIFDDSPVLDLSQKRILCSTEMFCKLLLFFNTSHFKRIFKKSFAARLNSGSSVLAVMM